MNIVEIINKKKNKLELTVEEINYFVDGFSKDSIPDYQASSLLMAIYLNGMTDRETTDLTLAMMHSGEVLDLSAIPGIKIDKHSTGGVGDKVSLILGPLLAYHGAKMAKMSGRGLGHSGGTIDKLESIPNFKVVLSPEDFIKQVNEVGVSIIAQSNNIALADKKLYALRDVTGTIESKPLISSSIMSKKLASGADCICLDVKVGSGAFMKTLDDAKELAKIMVNIGKLAGKKVSAILTNMDEPLGHKIGNGLEVIESIETLQGKGPKDLVKVVCTIGANLLVDSKIESDYAVAYEKLQNTLSKGLALNKFKEFITAQGSNTDVVGNLESLKYDAKVYEYKAIKSGYITKIDSEHIGLACCYLGAGRFSKKDQLHYGVGLDFIDKIGSKVSKGQTICYIYHDNKNLDLVIDLLDKAILIDQKTSKINLIYETIK